MRWFLGRMGGGTTMDGATMIGGGGVVGGGVDVSMATISTGSVLAASGMPSRSVRTFLRSATMPLSALSVRIWILYNVFSV